MGKNANFVSHKKSKLKDNGGPKLPLAADLVEGEIAINFGKDVETLSIKNESGDVVTFSSDNYYTEKKLGSGFTGENSGVTVTEALENIEITVDQVIDSGTSASTHAVATKAVVDKLIEDEQVWAISLNELNNNKFGYAEFDNNSKSIEFYKDSDEASSGVPISTVDLSSFSIDVDQVIDSGTSASTDAVSTSAVYGFVTSYTPSITVDQDFSNTASTNPISTKAVYSSVTENELVWTNAFVALSGDVSAHTANTEIHVTAADKMAWNAKLDASAIADFFDDAKYEDSGTTKVINFYHGDTIKATIDASDFIVDKQEVEVNSGDTPISDSVELWVDESYSSATADVYSKAEIDSLLTLKQDAIEDNAVIGGGYGVCRTAGVTSAKTVTINDFVLVPNMHVSVLFEHAFEVSNPTLNINDTGAYPIMLYSYPIPMFKITEETILTMVFDGTNYNVVSIEREVSLPGVSAVDLGLPSGVKWASMNVEAQTPEDNGLYFSWGNVIGHAKGSEPDFGTSNDTEPYVSSKGAEITGGSGTQIAVGNTYDMAHATMGYPWRLPTYADFQELCSNCTSTWVTQNDVRGRRFVSNINGEAIFFPATGYYNSTILTDEGTYGKYWSSVLASESAAHDFSFNSESVNYQNSNQRYLGFNVRAVQ